MGDEAASGAGVCSDLFGAIGAMGGEITGVTSKSDGQINEWVRDWLAKYQSYNFTEDNCQKFAWEFTYWLTGGIFTIPHR